MPPGRVQDPPIVPRQVSGRTANSGIPVFFRLLLGKPDLLQQEADALFIARLWVNPFALLGKRNPRDFQTDQRVRDYQVAEALKGPLWEVDQVLARTDLAPRQRAELEVRRAGLQPFMAPPPIPPRVSEAVRRQDEEARQSAAEAKRKREFDLQIAAGWGDTEALAAWGLVLAERPTGEGTPFRNDEAWREHVTRLLLRAWRQGCRSRDMLLYLARSLEGNHACRDLDLSDRMREETGDWVALSNAFRAPLVVGQGQHALLVRSWPGERGAGW